MGGAAKTTSTASTMYQTQGTVQVELTGATIGVGINPVQEFAVKYCRGDYIVFMPDSTTLLPNVKLLDAKACEKSQIFSARPDLKQALTDAALKGSRVEVKVDFSKTPGEIVSIKIPATL
jgi:hypothetical protein